MSTEIKQGFANLDNMLYISFNQDSQCFSVGTERGFKIFSTYPLTDSYERILNGGIGIVEMFYKTNILALVGGGHCPKYNKNNVIIYDDLNSKIIGVLKFTTSIKNVKLRKEKIFIVTEKKVFLFNMQNYENLATEDTSSNPKGLIAISTDDFNINTSTIFAFPFFQNTENKKGTLKIKNLEKGKELIIEPHANNISYLVMNKSGSLVATASDDGIIIRIHRCSDGALLQELRRGKEKADISCICFDSKNKFIGVSSDRGTIHIWSLITCHEKMKEIQEDCGSNEINVEEGKIGELPKNSTSFFENLPGIFGFQKGDISFAKIRIENMNSIFTFSTGNTIIIISSNGMYYEAKFDDKNGGEGKIVKNVNLKTFK